MSYSNLLKKSSQLCTEVQSIFNQMSIHPDITYASYARLYFDSGLTYLSTSDKWLDYYLGSQHHTLKTFARTPEFAKNEFILWDLITHDTVVKETQKYFGGAHGITLLQKGNKYFEIISLCTDQANTHMTGWYVNNLDKLKLLKICIPELIGHLADDLRKDRVYCQDDRKLKITDINLTKPNNTLPSELKTIYIKSNSDKIKLTRKELECAILLLQGHSAKQSAILLNKSDRTIEGTLANIKNKLNCKYKSELIQTLKTTDVYTIASSIDLAG